MLTGADPRADELDQRGLMAPAGDDLALAIELADIADAITMRRYRAC